MPETLDHYTPSKPEPRIGGSGNHLVFDEKNGSDINILPGSPKQPDQFLLVQGVKPDGGKITHVWGGGVFFALEDGDGRVQSVGWDSGSSARVSVGSRYGDIDVSTIAAITPPDEGEDPLYSKLVERRDGIIEGLNMVGQKRGAQVLGVIRRSEEGHPVEEERFQPEKALKLKSNSDVNLVELDNFIAPPGEYKPSTLRPKELQAYYDRQRHHMSMASHTVNFATHSHTIERNKREDAREKMRTAVDQFLRNDVRGAEICQAMDIQPGDLFSLTPKQAIELIGHVVYETTNYNHDATKGRPNIADSQDALSILEHGMQEHSKKSDIPPLGVCRNFAAVGRELFYAMKEENDELRNVDCFYDRGGATAYSGSLGPAGGHMWLDFVMAAHGEEDESFLVVTVDPTWTKKTADGKLQGYSQTDTRISRHVRTLATGGSLNLEGGKTNNANHIMKQQNKVLSEALRALIGRYKTSNGEKLSLGRIPNKDRSLQRLVNTAIETKLFHQILGGDSEAIPSGINAMVMRSADMPTETLQQLGASERVVVLESLLDKMAHLKGDPQAKGYQLVRARLDNMVRLCAGSTPRSSDRQSSHNTIGLQASSQSELAALYGAAVARQLAAKLGMTYA